MRVIITTVQKGRGTAQAAQLETIRDAVILLGLQLKHHLKISPIQMQLG